ncbi:hypothetical protein QCA50_001431 [Cerrena zonata]|uniref:Uncharacterized protein n=1 Tax=Cerrena zonata TaxID=2478898 RepID=A0AAW0GLD4_9APHY
MSTLPTPMIGAAESTPLEIPKSRERAPPIAGSPSSVASTSDSGPSEPSTHSSSALPPSSRLWRKLTGRTVSDDKEGIRQKAMNGMSELVKTVSRTRTAPYSRQTLDSIGRRV